MWRCPNCGTAGNPDGAVCRSCGGPGDGVREVDSRAAAPGEWHGDEAPVPPEVLARKIRRARFIRDPGRDWAWRGALLGFDLGLAFSLAVVAVNLYRANTAPHTPAVGDFALLFISSAVNTVLLFPAVLALGALLVGGVWGVLRPIIMALFCSPERFEREYGLAGGRLGRPPGQGK